MKIKITAAITRYLRRKNADFKRLSRGQQRVQIARDVISQLDAKKLIARSRYFNPTVGFTVPEDVDVSEVTSQIRCQVCGIGSLFVAAVERCDKLKWADFSDGFSYRDSQVDYLRKWFDSEQLDTIESYYEQLANTSEYNRPIVDDDHPIIRCANNKRRMKMIMENIVSNKGRFDPHKGTHSAFSFIL